MKLSKRQAEIVKKMRAGGEIWVSTNRATPYLSKTYKIEVNGESCLIHHSTFMGLRDKGIIGPNPYELTKLGKTIELS